MKRTLEAWGDFGPAWGVQRFSVEMMEPTYARIVAYPMAWTPSTDGVVRGTPTLVQISSPEDFDEYRGKLREAIVMLGRPSRVASPFEAPSHRMTGDDLAKEAAATDPGEPASYAAEEAEWLEIMEDAGRVVDFLKEEGIAALLRPSGADDHVINVSGLGNYLQPRSRFPAFVISKEQYGRIMRLLAMGVPVTLELSLSTTFDDSDTKGYNVVAEIPGTDPALKDQVVMLGGHFDSWHSGTGAVDNGAGSAVAMEAMRILQDLGVRPRRTIRIGLWGGEEQDDYGSVGYVKQHFGDPLTGQAMPDAARVSAYFNLDNGSGKVRGVYLQGNERVRPIFEAWLAPFADLGASTLTVEEHRRHGPHVLRRGGHPRLPVHPGPPGLRQPPAHANLDVYEAASQEDLEQAAVILASFVYHAAMRDEMLPRTPR